MQRKYTGLTFDQIHIFLTAAKYENFSRAAVELHMTQSAVSRSISAMEGLLGIVLFVRRQRQVRLTNAGVYCAKKFEHLTRETSDILEKAYQVQGNQFDNLSVCSTNVLNNNRYLMPIIQAFEKQHPLTEVSFEIVNYSDQIEALLSRTYDIGFAATAWEDYFQKNGFRTCTICEDVPDIMLSARHPLYPATSGDIPRLLLSPIVIISDSRNLYKDWALKVLREIGLPHGELVYVSSADTASTMLDYGSHIYLGHGQIHFYSTEKIQFIPLEGMQNRQDSLYTMRRIMKIRLSGNSFLWRRNSDGPSERSVGWDSFCQAECKQ